MISVKEQLYVYANIGDGAKEVFRGVVWKREERFDTDTNEVPLVCYDRLIYLQESKDNLFVAKGKNTKTIIESIASEWGFSVTYKYKSITHGKIVYRNHSIADMFISLLDEVKKQTGVNYIIKMDQNKIIIDSVGTNTTIYKIQAKQNLINSSRSETMDGMVTKIKIVKSKTSSDEEYTTVATVSKNTETYGTLQDVIIKGKDDALSVAKEEANTILKEKSTPKKEGEFSVVDEYEPKNSLLHRVVIKRQKTLYPYYQGFLRDALRLRDTEGKECPKVSYFSYVPQYDQLSEEQLRFYLYFRSEARKGNFLSVDYSYLLLYIYELLNLGERQDTQEAQGMLMRLWNAYSEAHPALEGKLADWICDFSLVHRLPPPEEGGTRLLRKVRALKEFYIAMPDGDREGCARSLLRFCTSYDYRGSKFATEENLPLFEKYVFGSVLQAVSYFSEGDRLLGALSFEDSTLARDAYAGALTVSEEKTKLQK